MGVVLKPQMLPIVLRAPRGSPWLIGALSTRTGCTRLRARVDAKQLLQRPREVASRPNQRVLARRSPLILTHPRTLLRMPRPRQTRSSRNGRRTSARVAAARHLRRQPHLHRRRRGGGAYWEVLLATGRTLS